MSYSPQVSGDPATLRPASLALSTSYDSTPTALRMQNWNQIVLLCDANISTATDIRVRVEVATPSGDGTPVAADWYTIGTMDLSSATLTSGVTAIPTGDAELVITTTTRRSYALPSNYKWIRVAAKATGTIGSATIAIKASQGMA